MPDGLTFSGYLPGAVVPPTPPIEPPVVSETIIEDGLSFTGWTQPPDVPPDPTGDAWRGLTGATGPMPNLATPSPIGSTTPNTGAFTTLAASGTVSGAGFTALLAPYAPLASPGLTGTPTAPTASPLTGTTQLATTAYVDAAAAAGAATATGGTTARSLANHFGDVVSVKDFGAKGDGVTDDSVAIREAAATGLTLYFPDGRYVYTGAYCVLANFGGARGNGPSRSVIVPSSLSNTDGTRTIFVNGLRNTLGLSTSTPAIAANQTDGHITIADLGFDLSGCITSGTSCSLASFLLATNIVLSNISADNFVASSNKGFSGIQLAGCDSVLIDRFYARHCVNAIDQWKGTTRVKISNVLFESSDTPGNGGVINFNGVGTLRADYATSQDLQITNATLWLRLGAIGIFLDGLGAGSLTRNIDLASIKIVAKSGTTNDGVLYRGQGNRLKARGLSFSADAGCDFSVPLQTAGFFDGTAAYTGTNAIVTANGSSLITVTYPNGADSGPGNYMRINNGSGGAVTGNGLSLNGYYLITAVSTVGSISGTATGDTFVVSVAPQVANADGALSGTTNLQGWWGCVASCDIGGVTFDGISAAGGDLISLGGSGHLVNGVVVTTNYNGNTTPQYRSIVAVDSTQAHDLATPVATMVAGIVGAPGTVSLQASWHGDNSVTWAPGGVEPRRNYSGTIAGSDHIISTTDATIGSALANNILIQGRPTGNPARILAQGTDTNVSLGLHWQGAGALQVQDGGGTLRHNFDTSDAFLALTGAGSPAFQATSVASQVNFITGSGGATGNPALLTAANSGDANVVLDLVAKGTSGIRGSAYTPAATPTTTDIPAGRWAVWKDTSGGTVKLYYNDAGSLVSTGIGGMAPLASPTFTGTVTAGTVNVGAFTATGITASPISGSTGSFTTLAASSTVSGAGFTAWAASPPAIGGTAAAAGSFTTLSASSTVSGAGFSTYLASPPAIGGTAAAAGSFTTLSASSTVSGAGFTAWAASPPAIGGTAAAAGSFTTLAASSTVSGAGFTSLLTPYAPLASPTFTGTVTAGATNVGALTASGITASPISGSTGSFTTLSVSTSFTLTPTTSASTSAGAILQVGDSASANSIPLTYSYSVGASSGAVAVLGFNTYLTTGGTFSRINTAKNGWDLSVDDRDAATDGSLLLRVTSSAGSRATAVTFTTAGGVTAGAGSFSTLAASSTVSGTGFTNYMASPPAIGATAPAAVTSTQINLTTSAGPNIRSGTGAASGTQPKGSIWLRTDGAAGSTLYVSQGGGTWNAASGI